MGSGLEVRKVLLVPRASGGCQDLMDLLDRWALADIPETQAPKGIRAPQERKAKKEIQDQWDP